MVKPFTSHSYAQIRASEPGINFKLEFTISQVDAHSTAPIIAGREREVKGEGGETGEEWGQNPGEALALGFPFEPESALPIVTA